MKNKIRKLFPQKVVPSGFVLTIDIIIVVISTLLAILFRHNYHTIHVFTEHKIIIMFVTILLVRSISFVIFKTHNNVLRYTSVSDLLRLVYINIIGSMIIAVINIFIYSVLKQQFVVPFSIVLLEFIITTFLMLFYRTLINALYSDSHRLDNVRNHILIYGAGELGFTTLHSINRDLQRKYDIIGFVDDDPQKIGKKIEGLPIYAGKDLPILLESKNIAHIIIAIENMNVEKRTAIAETCLNHHVKTLVVPPVQKWINGELSFKQIKKIRIEDLLSREPIQMSDKQIQKFLLDKTILVTGAAGSIGSEIVRQLTNYNYKQMILIDNAESPMYFLELDLKNLSTKNNYITYIGNICHEKFMSNIFETYHPNVVFHAAAYKHVPLMEKNPMQAIEVNVLGTKNLADLSVKNGVEKFVMISTDKAVNPTSIMGASKRLAEMYVQSLNQKSHCKFITTRFGNVLGSNGSIIPILKQQIEKGGPVTITHPEVTRFFMTIPEACELVLQAGSMGEGGEIYVFDMGKSVKIYDLATKMIHLSGLELGKDIQIVFTGLRPGEKLYEEVLANEENTSATQNDKIKIAKVQPYNYDDICRQISDIAAAMNNHDEMLMVKLMKHAIPEFKSQNSKFEILDE
ncbi:MAG: polysaccharide biosynthesis protein [Bacteroidales bacterium]|nr:polysaccharide biosynthesis protein [Bacteroidales bacterium]